MSTMQWQVMDHDGITVVELVGYLSDATLDQFDGAIEWVLSSRTCRIVLDLSRLQGWSTRGEQAIKDAASRVAARGKHFALCSQNLAATSTTTAEHWHGITVFANLAAARATLTPPASASAANER